MRMNKYLISVMLFRGNARLFYCLERSKLSLFILFSLSKHTHVHCFIVCLCVSDLGKTTISKENLFSNLSKYHKSA